MRSPITDAIDRACGVPPGWTPPRIALRCPSCGATATTVRRQFDPRDARTIEAPCPSCVGDTYSERYLDAAGVELRPNRAARPTTRRRNTR
jgi:hypothetical protein